MMKTPYLDRRIVTQQTRLAAARVRLRERPGTGADRDVTDLEEDIAQMTALEGVDRELGEALLALDN